MQSWQCITAAAVIVGTVLLIFGMVLQFCIIESRKEQELKGTLQVNEGSKFYQGLIEPSESLFKIYVYNVTNPDEVIENGAIPQLREIGPYTYRHLISNENVTFVDEDTVRFNHRLKVEFLPELSDGLQGSDIVTIVDCTYLGVLMFINNLAGSQFERFSEAFNRIFMNRQSSFITATVDEIFFTGLPLNCSDHAYMTFLICRLLARRAPEYVWMDENRQFKYALLRDRNMTNPNSFDAYRGIHNLRDRGYLKRMNNDSLLPYWGSPECNMFNGSLEGMYFRPYTTPHENVQFFEPKLYRSISISYVGDVYRNGLKCMRFEAGQDMFAAIPDNNCFCPRSLLDDELSDVAATCPPTGFFNLARYIMAPVLVSHVRFLHSNETMDDMLLNRKEMKHEDLVSFAEIHPLSGLLVRASKRLQFNIELRRISAFDYLKKVPEIIVPSAWCDISYDMKPSFMADLIDMDHKLEASIVIGYAISGLGAVIALTSISLLYYIKTTTDSKVTTAQREGSKETSPDTISTISAICPIVEMSEKNPDQIDPNFSPYAVSCKNQAF